MAFVNKEAQEIHCKIVYYGPSLGGKTTNMQWVYKNAVQRYGGSELSQLHQFATEPERTLFFDFLPFDMGEIRGMRARLHLYTVPGQVVYDSSRKLILKGLDGVIFVADSQLERMDENIESMKNLEKNLQAQGYDIHSIPMALQYNKRDLPNTASVSELRAALNRYNSPDFEGRASMGDGVLETLRTVSKAIVNVLKGSE